MSPPMIDIDGSQGEGGGQMLRSSLALSLLTGRAFHLRNVRAGRPKPGLAAQHLQSVLAAAEIGSARVRGATLGSCDLVFEPGAVTAGTYRFDIGTAGATGLVLHTICLPLALRGGEPSEVTITGGTHVSTSPSFHFNDVTWRGYLALMGLQLTLRLERPGFYPRGGGVIRASIQPCAGLHGITLTERGRPSLTGFSAVAGLDRGIAARQAKRARQRLKDQDFGSNITQESWDGGPGSVLVLQAEVEPVPAVFVELGARGKPAEEVADVAVEQVLAYANSDAVVDCHSGDQLVLPLALAAGPSEYTVTHVTQHLLTNIDIIRRFVDREIVCDGEEGKPGRVVVR